MSDPRFPPVNFLADNVPWDHPQYIPNSSASNRPPQSSNIQNSFPVLNNTPGGASNAIAAPTTLTPQDAGNANSIKDAHHYAQIIGLFIAVTQTSQKFLDQSPTKRNLLLLRNNSATANLYIDFGKDASINSTLKLTPNQMILFDTVVPQDDLFVLGDTAGFLSYSFSTIAG